MLDFSVSNVSLKQPAARLKNDKVNIDRLALNAVSQLDIIRDIFQTLLALAFALVHSQLRQVLKVSLQFHLT